MTITLEQRNALLDQAKALVLAGWTQGADARDAQGRVVSSHGGEATCWCVSGALARSTRTVDESRELHQVLVRTLFGLGMVETPVHYNDTPGRTKYEVAALFDHAKEMPL